MFWGKQCKLKAFGFSYSREGILYFLLFPLFNFFLCGKDYMYSGAKFFYTEPKSLNKAHSTK